MLKLKDLLSELNLNKTRTMTNQEHNNELRKISKMTRSQLLKGRKQARIQWNDERAGDMAELYADELKKRDAVEKHGPGSGHIEGPRGD